MLAEKAGEKFVVGEPTGKYRFYINSIKAEPDTGNGYDKVRPSY